MEYGGTTALRRRSSGKAHKRGWRPVVEHPEHYGTAFFLKGVGLVTAAHCVEGVTEVNVLHSSKHTTTFPVDVLHFDKDRDLAVLDHAAIPATEFYELETSAKAVAVTDAVTAIGYPE